MSRFLVNNFCTYCSNFERNPSLKNKQFNCNQNSQKAYTIIANRHALKRSLRVAALQNKLEKEKRTLEAERSLPKLINNTKRQKPEKGDK